MKLKNAHILYDEGHDVVALVEFVSHTPVNADDRTTEFTTAMLRFLTAPQLFKGHVYRAWVSKVRKWLNMTTKSKRVIQDQRGNHYTITVSHKKVKPQEIMNNDTK